MTRETNAGDNSIRERITFWMMAGEIVAERPLLGAGEGMFGPNFHASLVRLVETDETGTMAYAQRLIKTWLAFETHNDYFEIAADRGLIGLGLFLAFGVALLGALARLSRDPSATDAALAHTLLVTLAGFHAIMASGFPLQTPARMTTYFLLVGLSISLLALQRPTVQEPE
jgi:O-antigen ligase